MPETETSLGDHPLREKYERSSRAHKGVATRRLNEGRLPDETRSLIKSREASRAADVVGKLATLQELKQHEDERKRALRATEKQAKRAAWEAQSAQIEKSLGLENGDESEDQDEPLQQGQEESQ